MPAKPVARPSFRGALGYLFAAIFGAAVVSSAVFVSPQLRAVVAPPADHEDDHAGEASHGSAAGHEDDPHADTTSVVLSAQAQRNIGLQTTKIHHRDFLRTITIPAVVVDHAGITEVDVAAPMTGTITRFFALEGEAVKPGEALFELRLTHEELVRGQSELLLTAEELDVVKREILRLEKVAAGGAVAGRRVLEQEYEQQKLEAAIKAHGESLILHGLTREQVDTILASRELLGIFTVYAPHSPSEMRQLPQAHSTASDNTSADSQQRLLYVNRLLADVGQHVTVGDPVFRLSDHTELIIEGKAFEHDAGDIRRAVKNEWPVRADFETQHDADSRLNGLKILYVSNVVEMESRALHLYLRLPNKMLHDTTTDDGHRFISWRYRPGQRLKLQIPVEEWRDRIVLPMDAIARDGAETFVFVLDGGHFDRRPVHVEFSDQTSAVIADDGSIADGDIVAQTAAHELLSALKAQSGGGSADHGHSH